MNKFLLPEKELTIGENKYKIIIFPAEKALRLQLKLAKIAAPLIPLLANIAKSEVNGSKESNGVENKTEDQFDKLLLDDSLIEKFTSFLSSLNDSAQKEIFEFTIEMFSATTVNGQSLQEKENFNFLLAGNTIEVWKVLFHIIKINFFSNSRIKG